MLEKLEKQYEKFTTHYLVTLDKNLIGNKKIESAFDIRICHPKDLLS